MNILGYMGDLVVPSARNNYRPHALASRSLSVYAGILVSVKILTVFSLAALPQSHASSSALTPHNVLQMTNSSREAYGLTDLSENTMLTAAAQQKAADMLKNQYFAHTSPEGKTPWSWVKGQGYNYLIAGENLAINFYSAEGVESAWMNSPGHKANILNKDFRDIGIGITQGTYKGAAAVFVVEMFATVSDQPIVTKNSSSFLNTQTQLTNIVLPPSEQASLSKPIISNHTYSLVNNNSFRLVGYAPGADYVYVLVNNLPAYKLQVMRGSFDSQIILPQGLNGLTVIGYYGNRISSLPSDQIKINVDLSAPVILSDDVQILNKDGSNVYAVQIKTTEQATKVVASFRRYKYYVAANQRSSSLER